MFLWRPQTGFSTLLKNASPRIGRIGSTERNDLLCVVGTISDPAGRNRHGCQSFVHSRQSHAATPLIDQGVALVKTMGLPFVVKNHQSLKRLDWGQI